MGQHTVAILMAAPLQYQLNTVKVLEKLNQLNTVKALEKVSFGDTRNPKAVC